jgi:ABC-type transport system involved in cytochrome bd biosynthesis fused ATPase/permease subunit
MTLRDDLPPDSARFWRYATILATTAVVCGTLLGGLSAWFLGAVAIAGLTPLALTFNIHIPGALVRLFAVGRTVARYGERLAGHRAALTDQVAHRVRLFAAMAMAPSVRRASWQLSDQSRLADYLDDVEDVDYARLRATLPRNVLILALTAASVGALVVAPMALVPIALLLLALGVTIRHQRIKLDEAWRRSRHLQRQGAARMGACLASATPLQGENRWAPTLQLAIAPFATSDDHRLVLRQKQATIEALAAFIGPAAAICILAAAWLSGARGEALLAPVFVAFVWLALGEPLQGISRIVIATLRGQTAREHLDAEWARPVRADESRPAAEVPISRLSPGPTLLAHRALARIAPNGRPIGDTCAIRLEAGRPTVLVGPSGVGKTSLLKQIAGWIGDDTFDSDRGPLTAAERQGMTAFCLHDAAILTDSVRANLFATEVDDAMIWQALAAVEMDERIHEAGGLEGWITQDMLSLGEAQRLNLARVWLSPKRLIVMDEPTEHLGPAMVDRILPRILAHLNDRVVVLSSHHAAERAGFDRCQCIAL